MPRRKYLEKRRPPYRRIPPGHDKLTRTAEQLYDLIFWRGLRGIWMSNWTLSKKQYLGCSLRSVQYARQCLVKCQVIIAARTNPHTWMMWARYHPAVMNCQVLRYPKEQKMFNPYYEFMTAQGGANSEHQGGAKFAPKLVIESTPAGPQPAQRAWGQDRPVFTAESLPRPEETLSLGAPPPTPPAVQGGQRTTEDRRIIRLLRGRINFLTKFGLSNIEAENNVLAEHEADFKETARGWIDEDLKNGNTYDEAFDLALMRRRIKADEKGIPLTSSEIFFRDEMLDTGFDYDDVMELIFLEMAWTKS